MKLSYFYVSVPELQPALSFYRDDLGLDEAWREGEGTVAFELPGTPVQLMLDVPRLRDEAAGPSEDLLQFTSIARTPPASSGPEVTRYLVNAIGATDHLLFAVALAIAAVAYLAGAYSNTYGSVLDYLLAFAAGAGTTFAANWKLLPWYGRLKQPKAGSAAATT